MIASVAFRNFKALRNTRLELGPFNLVIGPNGSGKTSLIQAIVRLRSLARLPLREPPLDSEQRNGAELTFRFGSPHDGLEVFLSCVSDSVCDLLQVIPLPSGEGTEDWAGLRNRLLGIRSYLFDHDAIAAPARPTADVELAANGGNLAAVLLRRKEVCPDAYNGLTRELFRMLPEYDAMDCVGVGSDGFVELKLRLAEDGGWIAAGDLSQGTLYVLAVLTLAFDPDPPSVVCIEEVDRGVHPRMLREIRDLLYRLSYPSETGVARVPVQVIATTHSPYMLDLFRDHPEEVVVTEKQGSAARFSRLDACADLTGILSSGSLGDLWFSGVIGGVPENE